MSEASLIQDGLPADVQAFALAAMGAAARASDPAAAVLRHWPSELDGERWVRVLAFGKASVRMASAAFGRLGPRVAESVVLAPPEWAGRLKHPQARVLAVDHPAPTERNVEAAKAVAGCAMSTPADAAVLVLISGGGSAHLTLPRSGVTLEDIRGVTDGLLRAGAPIADLNTVRRGLEQLKGGGLRAVCSGDAVTALVVSDVVGDDLATIASGPLVQGGAAGDPLAVLERWGVAANERVRAVLAGRSAGGAARKPADQRVVLNGEGLLEGMGRLSNEVGMPCRIGGEPLIGEAREAGRALAARAAGVEGAVVAWGETTVTVGEAKGLGGRNLEVALASALAMPEGRRWGVLTLATDGVDGPTAAAGAVLCSEMFAGEGRTLAANALRHHDSYHAVEMLGGLVRTGPTGTNVNDVSVVWWR